jgi:small-conductance mechanosensitive channel
VLEEPAPEILTEELGDATLNLAARFWVNQQTHNLFAVHSEVVDAINAVAEREGIDLPYPIQVVKLEADLPFETPLS